MMFASLLQNIELNPTELCNLKCTFCPRAEGYPNQNLHMSLDTAKEIRKQIDEMEFSQSIIFAGRGEPTLTKDFDKLLDIFLENNPAYHIKVTTNGKRLDSLERFFNNSKVHFGLDCYSTDREEFLRLTDKYMNCMNIFVAWKPDIGLPYTDPAYDKYPMFGNLSNRAGALEGTAKAPDQTIHSCHKLIWNMYIDWNGNYNLCCDDWTPLVLGNIFEETIYEFIETNETLSRYRRQHFMNNSRVGLPGCENCTRYSLFGEDKHSGDIDIVKNVIKVEEVLYD